MSKKVCSVCGSNHILEIIYGATVVRDLYLGNGDDWDLDSEEIDCQETTIVYECPKCNFCYTAHNMIDVLKEMGEEE